MQVHEAGQLCAFVQEAEDISADQNVCVKVSMVDGNGHRHAGISGKGKRLGVGRVQFLHRFEINLPASPASTVIEVELIDAVRSVTLGRLSLDILSMLQAGLSEAHAWYGLLSGLEESGDLCLLLQFTPQSLMNSKKVTQWPSEHGQPPTRWPATREVDPMRWSQSPSNIMPTVTRVRPLLVQSNLLQVTDMESDLAADVVFSKTPVTPPGLPENARSLFTPRARPTSRPAPKATARPFDPNSSFRRFSIPLAEL
mmetsp:Transcript_5513/g.8561  ORF Transcript_5513/g.8561 Transcript_5513/m.8561 type:complete len:255 (+) Transcript_5513:35-799(+)